MRRNANATRKIIASIVIEERISKEKKFWKDSIDKEKLFARFQVGINIIDGMRRLSRRGLKSRNVKRFRQKRLADA